MEKCNVCQFYDRKNSRSAEARNMGQCRRNAPQLNPVNQKSYMIEGVWPTVRDDDWCGEFRSGTRRPEGKIGEPLTSPLSSLQSPPRMGPLTGLSGTMAITNGGQAGPAVSAAMIASLGKTAARS